MPTSAHHKNSKADTIKELVTQLGLLNPHLPRADRSAGIAAICDQVGCSQSTVYNHLDRLMSGKPQRKPRVDKGACRALPAEVQTAAGRLFTAKRWKNTPTRVLHRMLEQQFPGVEINYATLQRLRETINEQLSRYVRSYATIEVGRPNEVWAIDCSPADFFVLMPGRDVPIRPQMTLCEDSCTRSIMYACYSATTGWDQIGRVLYNSIRPQSDQWPQGGIPEAILLDWGKVFAGEQIELALDRLGIRRIMSHPYYPQDKGKCERVIGSVHRMAEALLPGYCGSDNKGEDSITPLKDFRQDASGQWFDKRDGDGRPILTLEQANEYLWAWISGYYNHQHAVRTTGQTPLQAWAQSQVVPRLVSNSFLEQAFLSTDHRKVRRGTITCNSLQYIHPTLGSYNGQSLEIRFDARDVREIHCYWRGERICTATVDSPLFTAEPLDLKELQSRKRHNRAVAAQKREFLSQWQHDITATDPTAAIYQANADALPYDGPAPQQQPDPIAGLSQAERDDLDGLYLGDMPLVSNNR